MDYHTSHKLTYATIETYFLSTIKIDRRKWKLPMMTAFEHTSRL